MDENTDDVTYYSVDALEDKEPGAMYNVSVPNSNGSGETQAILTYRDNGAYTIADLEGNPINVSTSDGIKVVDTDAYRTKADNYQTLSGTSAATTTTTTTNQPDIKIPDWKSGFDGSTESENVRFGDGIIVAKTRKDLETFMADKYNFTPDRIKTEIDKTLENGRLYIAEGEGANIPLATPTETQTPTTTSDVSIPDWESGFDSSTESKNVRFDNGIIVAKTRKDLEDFMAEKYNFTPDRIKTEIDKTLENGRLYIAEGEGANINNGSTTTTTTTSSGSNQTARINGIGSSDLADMHDDKMHHTHVTQKVGSGVYLGEKDDYTNFEPYYRDLLKDENGNVIVDENGYAKKNKAYVSDGENRTRILTDNPYLASIAQGNILGNKNHNEFSKLDYICAYAATGQWSVKDLKVTVDYLASECGVNFKPHPQSYFQGTELACIYEDIKNDDYAAKAEEMRATVAELEASFKAKHDEMESWCGSASDAATEAIQCILGKFEVTMGNITKALDPACAAMAKFIEDLTALKEKEEELEELKKKVEKALTDCSEAEAKYNSIQIPAEIIGREVNPVTKKVVREYVKNYSEIEAAKFAKKQAYDSWQDYKKIYDMLVEEQEAMMKLMDEMLYNVVLEYYQIKNFETSVQTFSSFFGKGSRSSMIASKEDLLKNHDAILTEFEDYSKMPVITNLSDYKVGDVIVFDDAHGYVYAISGPYDPLTGTVTIACYDKTGKKIGDDIVIWDQREIVPIKYVREYDHEIYDGYPESFITTPPEPTPTPTPTKPPKEPTPPPGNPPEDPTTPPPPTHPEPTPPTPTPTTPPTNPTTPPTNPTTPPTNPTTPPTIPSTYPEYPTTPQNPYGPHTGLDAIYSSGDTTQSSSGLGALAGLAVGAAGLGLTGLMDKDEDKDEEEHKDKEVEKGQEEKKDEVKEETKEEQTTEATASVDIHE